MIDKLFIKKIVNAVFCLIFLLLNSKCTLWDIDEIRHKEIRHKHEWTLSKAPYLGEVGEEVCDLCAEIQVIPALDQEAFYGTWTAGGAINTTWTVKIDACRLVITNSHPNFADINFTQYIDSWGEIISKGTEPSVTADYKKGYWVIGPPATANNALNIGTQTQGLKIFLHTDLDKMWVHYVESNDGARFYYLQ